MPLIARVCSIFDRRKPEKGQIMSSRRDVLQAIGIASAAALATNSSSAQQGPAATASQSASAEANMPFWPNGARIAVTASLMLEAGGQNLYRSEALTGPL